MTVVAKSSTNIDAKDFNQKQLVTKQSSLNEEAGYKRKGNWPIFRDLLALGNGYNY